MSLPDEVFAERVAELCGFLTLGQGFDLFLLVSPGPEETARYARELLRALGEPWSVVRLDPYADPDGVVPAVSHERLVERVGQPLVEGRAPGSGPQRVVLVDATEARPQDQRTWDLFFAWLSRNRNLIARRLGCPLLIAVNRRQYAEFAGMAPDLWSIRSDVVELEPRPVETDEEAGAELDDAVEAIQARSLGFRGDKLAVLEFIEAAFTEEDFKLFVVNNFDIKVFEMLPDSSASFRTYAAALFEVLARAGHLDDLEHALLRARPRKANDILDIFGGRMRAPRGTTRLPREVPAPSILPPPNVIHSVLASAAPIPGIVLSSYNPEEVLPDRPNRLRLYRPADEEDRSAWEQTFGGGLLALREELRAAGRAQVLLHPACTLAVAIRAGAVFHGKSRFQVMCTQRVQATGRLDVWDLSQQRTRQMRLIGHRAADPDPTEVHLLVSASQDVVPAWERWRYACGTRAIVVRLKAAEGGPRELDLQDVLGWASAARRVAESDASGPPLRIFFAGSVALAVALGMRLIGRRTVHLMDFDHRAERYVESFRFEAGV